MCDSFVLSLKWGEFKRKHLTKYPKDLLEKLWPVTEKVMTKMLDGKIICDWSIQAFKDGLFVSREKDNWYLIRPETKKIWLATKPDMRHLDTTINIPLWEVDELIDSLENLLKHYVKE